MFKLFKLFINIIAWISAAFWALLALAIPYSFQTILFIFLAAATLPIKPIRNLWRKVSDGKHWVKPLVLILVFFWAVFATPISDTTDTIDSQSENTSIEARDDKANDDKASDEETSSLETVETPSKTPGDTAIRTFDISTFDISTIPVYSGNASYIVNGNLPYFSDNELTTDSFETYSELDSLGRCGTAFANISKESMPTEERGPIGNVRPSGWHTQKYNDLIDGNYLYNRCHLIAYQLTGENANIRNLITGTRYLNTEGMLPYEKLVGDYVRHTENHVLYRVTPVFEGDNLIASGVLLEAKSVEDNGAGIMFHVYCYNVQPGIEIDYATGESRLDDTLAAEGNSPETDISASATEQSSSDATAETPQQPQGSFAVNSKNGKIHKVGVCPATGTDHNAMKSPVYFSTYDEALAYSQSIAPSQEKRDCGNCW